MIVRKQPTFKDIFFAVKGSILPHIARRLLAIASVCIVAILAAMEWPGIFARISAMPFTLIGIALSVFMSFRSNACYARWWEGRQLWGEMIIACRSFAREIATLKDQDRRYMLRGLCAFVGGLGARLRGNDEAAAIAVWYDIGRDARGPNPTDAVLGRIGRRCLELMHDGGINAIHYSVLDGQLNHLAHVQGGCERILLTPVPFSYSLLLLRTASAFCVALPFALAGSLGWWTLLPVLLVAYTFFGLDALSHQLEDPFGLAPNALPLGAMQRTVEREMLWLLGDEELPPPLQPVLDVLN
jgi:putative membrane protein